MDTLSFFSTQVNYLFLSTFFNGEFSTIVAALGANVVIHYLSSAVAACGQLRFLQRVVRSSLSRSGLRESVFWMWHIIIFFYLLFHSVYNSFSAAQRGSISFSSTATSSEPMYFVTSLSHSPSGCICCIGMRTATYSYSH